MSDPVSFAIYFGAAVCECVWGRYLLHLMLSLIRLLLVLLVLVSMLMLILLLLLLLLRVRMRVGRCLCGADGGSRRAEVLGQVERPLVPVLYLGDQRGGKRERYIYT